MVSLAGVLMALLGLCYAAYLVAEYLLLGNPVSGWTTIVTAVLFFAGINLISLGVVGEYVARIFDEVKGRPLYVVRRRQGRPPPATRRRTDGQDHATAGPLEWTPPAGWFLLAIGAWLAALIWYRPLTLPDEGRYAGVAWDMLRAGSHGVLLTACPISTSRRCTTGCLNSSRCSGRIRGWPDCRPGWPPGARRSRCISSCCAIATAPPRP